MNKIYLLTAAFAVMASLSGCSDTELASIDTAQEKTPIGFHTVGSQMGSRAKIISNGEDLKSTDFNVFAFEKKADGTDGAFLWVTSLMTLAEQESTFLILKKVNGIIQQAQTSSIGQLPL